MTWHIGRMVAFDVETTGVDYETDRVVTAAVIAVGGDRPTQTATWLIDPGIDIPDGAAAIHGVTTAHAQAHGDKAPDALDEIAGALAGQVDQGAPVVAMNARYDLTMLDRELRRWNLPTLTERIREPLVVIDPMVLDKQVDRFRRGGRKLVDLCRVYGVQLGEDQAHDCSEDALAAARVAYRIAVVHPRVQMPAADLHRLQVGWAAEQAASLQEYFRSPRGGQPDAVVEGAWPLVPFRGEA